MKNGFLVCPNCRRNRHLQKIDPDTEATNLPVYCRDCKTENRVDIREGQCFESRGR
ncbi:MAG: cysteine-rich KTR domain-containing protein [Clostridiales bacterium]|nr:cysteine-rich KTR domain-containing protein [Clostridiales bacterium]